MNQEYTVVTYIDNVSLMFTNGYPESEKIAPLYKLDNFLATYLKSGSIADVKNKIIMSVYNLRDHTGTRKDMFKEQTLQSSIPPALAGQVTSIEQKFWAKDEAFTQPITGTTFTVPGIITQVEKHILSTDSVITEALLGQAEALDCYNISLQKSAVLKTELENAEKSQQIEVINSIDFGADNLETRSNAYKKIFGECCEHPDNAG